MVILVCFYNSHLFKNRFRALVALCRRFLLSALRHPNWFYRPNRFRCHWERERDRDSSGVAHVLPIYLNYLRATLKLNFHPRNNRGLPASSLIPAIIRERTGPRFLSLLVYYLKLFNVWPGNLFFILGAPSSLLIMCLLALNLPRALVERSARKKLFERFNRSVVFLLCVLTKKRRSGKLWPGDELGKQEFKWFRFCFAARLLKISIRLRLSFLSSLRFLFQLGAFLLFSPKCAFSKKEKDKKLTGSNERLNLISRRLSFLCVCLCKTHLTAATGQSRLILLFSLSRAHPFTGGDQRAFVGSFSACLITEYHNFTL